MAEENRLEFPEPVEVRPIGVVRSEYAARQGLPHQGRGQDIEAEIELRPELEPAYREIVPGDLLWVLSWFHQAERDRLRVHPRGNPANPMRGVFKTRSPVRPNPIGLSLVEVVAANGNRLRVKGLETLDGTPVLDIKPYAPNTDR